MLYLLLFVALSGGATICSGQDDAQTSSNVNVPLIKTNISLVGADSSNTDIHQANNVMIDPKTLINEANIEDERLNDIQEDEDDRFITTRSGKLRPRFEPDANEWAEEPESSLGGKLIRKKRCGGGDDDGDAYRSRRARRTRRARRARRARKSQKSKSTTTVTRKVIQNGQVISSDAQQQQQATVQQTVQQPAIIQQQPAIIKTVQPQNVPPQAQIIQQQPQVIQQAAAPVSNQIAAKQAQVVQSAPQQQQATVQQTPPAPPSAPAAAPAPTPAVQPQVQAPTKNTVSAEGSVSVSL